jgi:hypothetical protein
MNDDKGCGKDRLPGIVDPALSGTAPIVPVSSTIVRDGLAYEL